MQTATDRTSSRPRQRGQFDPDTGHVDIVAYSSVNDIGRVVSPVIVTGQIEGGAVPRGPRPRGGADPTRR